MTSLPDWHQQLLDCAQEWRADADRATGAIREQRLMLARFIEAFSEFSHPKDAERALSEWFLVNPAFERVSNILHAAQGRRVVADYRPRRVARWQWAWQWR